MDEEDNVGNVVVDDEEVEVVEEEEEEEEAVDTQEEDEEGDEVDTNNHTQADFEKMRKELAMLRKQHDIVVSPQHSPVQLFLCNLLNEYDIVIEITSDLNSDAMYLTTIHAGGSIDLTYCILF